MRQRIIVLLFLLASPAAAQDTLVKLWTREVVNSSKLHGPRDIYVATPEHYRTRTDRYPVLIILDANDLYQFNLALANVAFLSNRNAIPEMIVVGIPNGRDRTHDLTPPTRAADAKEFPTAGGAAPFADFIVDEVVPLVRSKYRTLSGTVLAGHSFGGLLALEVASKKAGSFSGVIAMSPALWWDDASYVVRYSDAIARSTKAQRLFVTSGGLEPDLDRRTQQFERRLDSLKPALTVFSHNHYENDTHGLTPGPSLADGLRFIFEPLSVAKLPIARLRPSSDSASVVNALMESKRQYANGARFFGLDERLPEGELNTVGYNVLAELKKPALAVLVFKQNVDLYPDRANTYDSLGDGLLAAGDTTGAIAQFRRAVDVGTRFKQLVIGESLRKLNLLEASRAAQ